jgi:Lrp/AsnC family transcriptional regulator
MKLDQKDRAILRLLQTDSSTTVKDMADRLGLSKTPVYERIKKYVKSGLISRYVAVLNPQQLPTTMTVFCSVSLDNQKLSEIQAFAAAIDAMEEVIECYLMGGSSDFLLKVMVRDLTDYHRFSSGKLAALPNVSQIKSTFVLNELKKSTVIPIYE